MPIAYASPWVLLLVATPLAGLGCDSRSSAPLPGTSAAALASGKAPASTSASTSNTQSAPAPEVRQLGSVTEAFALVIADAPRVLAIGEAHAQKDQQGPTAAQLFTSQLLPTLKGKATDLLVELMLPAKGCAKKVEAVREKQKVVTEKQSTEDQSDYVKMGDAAKTLGIVPDLLRPSCADLDAIDKAGADAIPLSLETITRLTKAQVTPMIERGDQAGGAPMVVIYGGAMHNDAAPPKERADWSYGAALAAKVSGKYTELDVYLPTAIKATDAWRRQPWYPHYDPARPPATTTLIRMGPRSWVLIFPTTSG